MVKLHGAVLPELTDFPSGPSEGRLAFVNNMLYIFTTVDGLSTWYPMTNRTNRHIHNQSTSSTNWVITHDLNSTQLIVICYDNSGDILLPSNISYDTNSQITVTFSTAQVGDCSIFIDMAQELTSSLQNIIEDTTPQLGGDLDINGKDITSTGGFAIDLKSAAGVRLYGGDGSPAGNIDLFAGDNNSAFNNGGGTINLYGGTGANFGDGGDIILTGGLGGPNDVDGIGSIVINGPSGSTKAPSVTFREGAGGFEFVGLKAPDSVTTSRTWVLPADDPSTVDGYFLKTDASGNLSFAEVTSGGSPDEIAADDSYVKVTDDGIVAGEVEVVVDAIQVLDLTETSQILGVSADTYVQVNQSTNKAAIHALGGLEVTNKIIAGPAAGGILNSGSGQSLTVQPGVGNSQLSLFGATNSGGTGGSTVISGGWSQTHTGGLVQITGGSGSGTSNGGDVILIPGKANGSGNDGDIKIATIGMAGYTSSILHFEDDYDSGTNNTVGLRGPVNITADRVWTLPQDDPATAAGQFLTTNSSGELSFDTASGISDLIDDTTPQLGGNLDVNGFEIVGKPSTGAAGGDVTLRAADSTNTQGGSVYALGGNGAGTNATGGQVFFRGGQGKGSGNGGVAALRGGLPDDSGTGQGGGVSIRGGDTEVDGQGSAGTVAINGGYSEYNTGGSVTITAGDSASAGLHYGGNVVLNSGDSEGTGDAGYISLNIGKASGAGNDGYVIISDAAELRFEEDPESDYVALKPPTSITTSRTWTLPVDDPTAVDGYFLTTNSSGELSFSQVESDQIFADDSYVKVVDDGVAAGEVEVVVDGVQLVDLKETVQKIGNDYSININEALNGTYFSTPANATHNANMFALYISQAHTSITGAVAANSSNEDGGNFKFSGGKGDGYGDGGLFQALGGQATDADVASDNSGGNFLVAGGQPDQGGSISLSAGNVTGVAGSTALGGSVVITAGHGGSAATNNGNVRLRTYTDDTYGGENGYVSIESATGDRATQLRFYDRLKSEYVAFVAPTDITTNRVWTLPEDDPSIVDGYFLKTDSSGNLSFSEVDVSPAGSDNQVQFNDNGSFGASANLTWTDSSLQVGTTGITISTNGDIGRGSGNLTLVGGGGIYQAGRCYVRLINSLGVDIVGSSIGSGFPGGTINITGGNGDGAGDGGNVVLKPGTGDPDGTVQLFNSTGIKVFETSPTGVTVTGAVTGETPTAISHLATKGYVDGVVSGLDWQESVLDKDLNAPPGSPTTGDRYLISAAPPTATGLWVGHDNEFGEWNGTSWDFTAVSEGMSCWVEDEDVVYVYNNTDWVKFGSTTTHNNASGLNDGDYKHLTAVEKTLFDTIESGATADQTAAEILTAIKTVDGADSGLDADLLDGVEASDFVLLSALTDYSLDPRLHNSIGFGNDAAIIYFNDATNETRSGYWTSKDGLEIRGDSNSMGNVVLKTGNLDIGANAYISGILGVGTSLTVNGNDVLTTADEGTGNGIDADKLDSLEASQFVRSDAADEVTGQLTFSNKPIMQDGIQWDNGSSFTFNKFFTIGSYFVQGEWFEVIEIEPSASSRNYMVAGDILISAGSSQDIIRFEFYVRSNTLPDLGIGLKYWRLGDINFPDVTLVYWKDTTNGVVKLMVKHDSTGTSIQNVTAKFNLLMRGNYDGDYDISRKTEVASLDSGFTETVISETAFATSEHDHSTISYGANTEFEVYDQSLTKIANLKIDGTNYLAFSPSADSLRIGPSATSYEIQPIVGLDHTFKVSGSTVANISANGLQLGGANATVNEISDDETLAGESTAAVVTERAIKAYVDDNASAGGIGSSFVHTQDTTASTWVINHNLGEKYVVVQVSNDDDEVIIPDSITYTNVNTATVTFLSNKTGHAVVSLGGASVATAGAFVHTQATASTTWVITHNLGIQYVNVEVADENDYAIIPDEVSFDSVNQLTITFLQTESGHAAITSGGIAVSSVYQAWQAATVDLSVASGNRLLVDTDTVGAVELTLPSSPTVGDEIWVIDAAINFATNNCTLDRNGENIEGIADDYILNVDRADVHLIYVGATIGWRVIS